MAYRKKIYTLTFSHRHGTDTLVYANAEQAGQGRVGLILNALDDVDDVRVQREICTHVLASRWDAAYLAWVAYQESRPFSPQEMTLVETELEVERPLWPELQEQAQAWLDQMPWPPGPPPADANPAAALMARFKDYPDPPAGMQQLVERLEAGDASAIEIKED